MDKSVAYRDKAAAMRSRIEDALENALSADCTALAPCRALLLSGGKRWRPLLFVLCAAECGDGEGEASRQLVSDPRVGDALSRGSAKARIEPSDEVYRLTPLVEFPHTASLIHDDIEDNAATRRGKPCAHITYGVDVAINAASYLYFLAAQCIDDAPLDDKNKCRLYAMYTDALRKLHEGQAMDIAWHKDTRFFPTVEQYYTMTAMKTGALAALAAGAGTLAGGVLCGEDASEDAIAKRMLSAVKLGVGFQALDDALDVQKGNPGKERGDDIVEGKKSLPILLHLQDKPDDRAKVMSLFERAGREGIKSSAVAEGLAMIEQSGAAQAAYNKGRALINEAREEFGTPLISAFIDELLGE